MEDIDFLTTLRNVRADLKKAETICQMHPFAPTMTAGERYAIVYEADFKKLLRLIGEVEKYVYEDIKRVAKVIGYEADYYDEEDDDDETNNDAFNKFCACFSGLKPAFANFYNEIDASDLSKDEKEFWKNLSDDFTKMRNELLYTARFFIKFGEKISRESWEELLRRK